MRDSIDVDKLSRILDVPIVHRSWTNYNFDGGWGSRTNKKTRNDNGAITNRISNEINVKGTLKSILNEDWDKCVSFWTGVFAFYFKDRLDLFTFSKDTLFGQKIISLSYCCENFVLPASLRYLSQKISKKEYNFDDFIVSAGKMENTYFDVNSALDAYKIQGDDARLSILCQMFWNGSRKEEYNILLTPGISIKYKPKISDFVSGVAFPCLVCPFPTNLKWTRKQNGWFLMDGHYVLDVYQINEYTLWNTNLGNRSQFLNRNGPTRNLTCYCWGDIVNAVKHFRGDVLVRSFNETLMNADWHRFGLGGLVHVGCHAGRIYGRSNKTRHVKNKKCEYEDREGRVNTVIDLRGKRKGFCDYTDIVYSVDELEDWFELAEMCKNKFR